MPKCEGLLDRDEPEPVAITNPGGGSPFLLVGDHAGNAIPRKLNALGLSAKERKRHIGWDIGVRSLGEMLATKLDAVFVHQRYSRLVIDCNREPASAEAIPEVSDGTHIPGNERLFDVDRSSRVESIHAPYHAEIAASLVERARTDRPTILIALHSFTPVMNGISRPWHIGVLQADGDTSFAHAMLTALRQHGDIEVGDNEPYRMDSTDHTIPLHAIPAGLPYVELEIRQDLIADVDGQRAWADRVGCVLTSLTNWSN
ncbi:MAG: N-formylglutamate amidohydrolase [Alphaproteobacteria bacterium]|nr:MAG: N-formylglutamate amidohydrolase [Alphaproteobacteria bacterium]